MAKKKNAYAQAMVKARNRKLTPARRSEIASTAARAKWAKWKTARVSPQPAQPKKRRKVA